MGTGKLSLHPYAVGLSEHAAAAGSERVLCVLLPTCRVPFAALADNSGLVQLNSLGF